MVTDDLHDRGPATEDPTGSEGETDANPRPRRSRRRGVLIGALVVGVLFAGLAVVMATRLDGASDYRGTALLGKPVPDLSLPTLDGETFDLRPASGKAMIINFWNSWCVPCREEEPALQAFFDDHRDDPDFAMVGIVRDDTRRAVRRWVEDHGTPWPVALDPGARAAIDFATQGQPETYAVTPDGVVVARHLGRATVDDLENLLALARGEGADGPVGPGDASAILVPEAEPGGRS